jgi:hypothetical protein
VLNVPPVTDWAAVTCACGKDRLTRPSQLLVAETGVVLSKMAKRETGVSATDLKLPRMAILPHGGNRIHLRRTDTALSA